MNILINYLKDYIKPFKTAVIAVFIAITASFGVSVISSAGKQLILEEMDAMGFDGMTASAYNSYGENATDISFFNTLKKIDDISKISPVVCNTADISFSNGITSEIMGWGIDTFATEIISLNVKEGRMFNESDIENQAYVCLIDKNLANKAYKRSNICGKNIVLTIGNKSAYFTIIGTVEKGSNILNTFTGDIVPDFVYIPYTTMYNLSTKPAFDQIIFTSNDTKQTVAEFKQKLVDQNYKYRNHTIKLTNLSDQKEQVSNITDIAFLSLFSVSCVAVLVCSMSIGSSVNTAVISKHKDIGIKISMGANKWNIAKEFLSAAILSCIIGILAGIFTIYISFNIIKYFFHFSFEIDYSLILLSIFATIILTVIFSLAPSYNAAGMSPIKALNRE